MEPRVLGALTFIAYLICAHRGRADFPIVIGENEYVRKAIFAALSWFMFWCVVWAAIFLVYAVLRRRFLVHARLVRRAEAIVAAIASRVLDRLEIAPHRSTMATRNDYLGRDPGACHFTCQRASNLFSARVSSRLSFQLIGVRRIGENTLAPEAATILVRDERQSKSSSQRAQ